MTKNSRENREEYVRLVAGRLREFQKKAGLGTKALSMDADIPYNTLRSYLSGRTEPGAHAIFKLANALGCRSDDILGVRDRGLPKPEPTVAIRIPEDYEYVEAVADGKNPNMLIFMSNKKILGVRGDVKVNRERR